LVSKHAEIHRNTCAWMHEHELRSSKYAKVCATLDSVSTLPDDATKCKEDNYEQKDHSQDEPAPASGARPPQPVDGDQSGAQVAAPSRPNCDLRGIMVITSVVTK
jgi:hypothetical protein